MGAILFIAGSVLGFLAVALSILWHRLDAALDKRFLREHEQSSAEDVEDLNARFARRQARNEAVRKVGVAFLYASVLCIFLASIIFGINQLDRHYNHQQEQCHGEV